MSITDKWIKKTWCTYTTEYYSVMKSNEIMPSAATQMALEMIRLSEVRQKQISYDITYIWNLKYNTNELIYKIETDSQTEKKVWLLTGKEEEG